MLYYNKAIHIAAVAGKGNCLAIKKSDIPNLLRVGKSRDTAHFIVSTNDIYPNKPNEYVSLYHVLYALNLISIRHRAFVELRSDSNFNVLAIDPSEELCDKNTRYIYLVDSLN